MFEIFEQFFVIEGHHLLHLRACQHFANINFLARSFCDLLSRASYFADKKQVENPRGNSQVSAHSPELQLWT